MNFGHMHRQRFYFMIGAPNVMDDFLCFKTACTHVINDPCSFQGPKFNRRQPLLIPSCKSKTEFSLCLIDLRIVALNISMILYFSFCRRIYSMHKQNMGKKYQTLWLLLENTFFYSVLLTKLNTLLHQKHLSKFENGKSL